jgi:hypothetical protein
MRQLVNPRGGAQRGASSRAQHPAKVLSWALRGQALHGWPALPEPGYRSTCLPLGSRPLWCSALRRRSVSRGLRRLEARHPQLKGLGLGGGGSWPFERLLQRVGDVLRALVRPPSPAPPRACARRECKRTQHVRLCMRAWKAVHDLEFGLPGASVPVRRCLQCNIGCPRRLCPALLGRGALACAELQRACCC